MSDRVVGVVLAAGAGRRFGRPKAGVGHWLITAVEALREGGCAEVAVVLGAARVAPIPGVRTLVAPDWATGMSASVRAAVEHARGTGAGHLALHVVDTPDVGPDVVARVIEAARTCESGIARASFAGRPGHPVVIARRHWARLLPTLSGDRGAAEFLRTVAVRAVECGDLAGGRDIDDPADLDP
ncbi:nucleotidyltransferase family protein [Nocardia spumae]|uniref:nucleotidyltransferase family protein n=1 Tax=Nocardia spumae TaxID=2887190 RepID=UPI001D15057A|nr:nucleotidyltransferase family protein [Nocardia spumae]